MGSLLYGDVSMMDFHAPSITLTRLCKTPITAVKFDEFSDEKK